MYLQVYVLFAYIYILFMVDLKIYNRDPMDYKLDICFLVFYRKYLPSIPLGLGCYFSFALITFISSPHFFSKSLQYFFSLNTFLKVILQIIKACFNREFHFATCQVSEGKIYFKENKE